MPPTSSINAVSIGIIQKGYNKLRALSSQKIADGAFVLTRTAAGDKLSGFICGKTADAKQKPAHSKIKSAAITINVFSATF